MLHTDLLSMGCSALFLIQSKIMCPGSGVIHSGLGIPSIFSRENASTGLPTCQYDRGIFFLSLCTQKLLFFSLCSCASLYSVS